MSWCVCNRGLEPPSSGPSVIKKGEIHFCKSKYPSWLVPHHFQELLEEVRKELQKVKEEIIEGEVFFYFKHLFILEASCPLESPVLEGKGEEAVPLTSAQFPSSLCPGAEEAGLPLTTGPQKIDLRKGQSSQSSRIATDRRSAFFGQYSQFGSFRFCVPLEKQLSKSHWFVFPKNHLQSQIANTIQQRYIDVFAVNYSIGQIPRGSCFFVGLELD